MSNGMPAFTESELAVLKHGPLYVLKHVAGADSHVDHAEWAALIDAVVAARRGEDELLDTVMGALAEDLRTGNVSLPDDRPPLDGLAEVRTILAMAPGDRGLHLREALLEIAATVAEASGAQLTRTFVGHSGETRWARSAGTSAQERAAIAAVAEALGLSS